MDFALIAFSVLCFLAIGFGAYSGIRDARKPQADPRPKPLYLNVYVVPGGIAPKYSREGDVGLDLYARLSKTLIISHGETVKVPVGCCMEIPQGWEGQIRPRSGGSARGMNVSFGTIDPTYRGELMVTVTNLSNGLLTIENQERIAQLIISPWTKISPLFVTALSPTERGDSGFGSSGKF